jgi:multiple antibiotic resistance protein
VKEFWLCFVPLFVALDSVGLLPIYVGLTEGMSRAERRRTLRQSLLTAFVVAVVFLFVGKAVLRWLGISVQDFMIAGGILLVAFAMSDLLGLQRPPGQVDRETVGAVPIGVPLMAGPAVLTTTILLADLYGAWLTVLAIVANIALVGAVFSSSEAINRLLGVAGARTASKIISVILAAFGVMMVRRGCLEIAERLLSATS